MFFLKQKKWIAVTLLASTMSGSLLAAAKTTVIAGEDEELPAQTEVVTNQDPLERYNRSMFAFNETFDRYILKPSAELYNAIMPRPLNKGIHNIFIAISEPATIANDLLQFNFYQSVRDLSRLAINLTVGVVGLFDVAGRLGLPHFSNDFGLTMGYWGYKNSSYLILPFLGPNTIRDGIGIPVDYYGFYIYPYINPYAVRFGVLSWFYVDYRAHALVYDPVLEEVAIDKYVFVRNAYLQRRAYQLEQIRHLGYKERNSKENPVRTDNG